MCGAMLGMKDLVTACVYVCVCLRPRAQAQLCEYKNL